MASTAPMLSKCPLLSLPLTRQATATIVTPLTKTAAFSYTTKGSRLSSEYLSALGGMWEGALLYAPENVLEGRTIFLYPYEG